MKIRVIWICCAVVIFAASNTDVAASEIVLMCKISRHALAGGEKKSDYRLRVELDDDRRTVKVDDTRSGIVVINKYSALSIEGSMGEFEFAINRETGEFARAVKTRSGAIVAQLQEDSHPTVTLVFWSNPILPATQMVLVTEREASDTRQNVVAAQGVAKP
jgi:hypothetical protein